MPPASTGRQAVRPGAPQGGAGRAKGIGKGSGGRAKGIGGRASAGGLGVDVAIDDYLQREGRGIEAYVDELRERDPFKTNPLRACE